MNATEDGLEPVGEHIDPFEAIQRGAVNNILSAADEVLATKQLAQRQAFALNKVRQLHRPGRTWPARDVECTYCCVYYPCQTIRAIDEAGV